MFAGSGVTPDGQNMIALQNRVILKEWREGDVATGRCQQAQPRQEQAEKFHGRDGKSIRRSVLSALPRLATGAPADGSGDFGVGRVGKPNERQVELGNFLQRARCIVANERARKRVG